MSFNTFGHLFRFTSFGESHGAAIGCVVDGCPPGISLSAEDIQRELDRRRPGQSRFTTQRQEPDAVKIMSGVFTDEKSGQQVTTGTPIMLMIENVDQRSRTIPRSRINAGRAASTYDIKTASMIIAAADAPPRARRPRSLPAPSPARSCRASACAAHSCKWARTKSTARAGTGTRSAKIRLLDAKKAKFFEEYLDGVWHVGVLCGAVIEVVAEGVRSVSVRRSMPSSTAISPGR